MGWFAPHQQERSDRTSQLLLLRVASDPQNLICWTLFCHELQLWSRSIMHKEGWSEFPHMINFLFERSVCLQMDYLPTYHHETHTPVCWVLLEVILLDATRALPLMRTLKAQKIQQKLWIIKVKKQIKNSQGQKSNSPLTHF